MPAPFRGLGTQGEKAHIRSTPDRELTFQRERQKMTGEQLGYCGTEPGAEGKPDRGGGSQGVLRDFTGGSGKAGPGKGSPSRGRPGQTPGGGWASTVSDLKRRPVWLS